MQQGIILGDDLGENIIKNLEEIQTRVESRIKEIETDSRKTLISSVCGVSVYRYIFDSGTKFTETASFRFFVIASVKGTGMMKIKVNDKWVERLLTSSSPPAYCKPDQEHEIEILSDAVLLGTIYA